MNQHNNKPLSLRATGIYLVFGLLWIIVSDTLLAIGTQASPDQLIIAEYAKGIGYVLLTALALYLILRRLEQHHQQEMMRFRFISDNARDVVFRYRLHPNPGYIYISPSVTEITGYTQEDHYSNPNLWLSIVHPLDRKDVSRLGEDVTTVERPLTIRWRHKNGSILWVEQRARLLLDKAGKPWALDGIVRDITRQKEMELALQQTVGKLDTLLASSPFPIVSLASQGTVLTWNRAAQEMFGYPEDEVIGERLPLFRNSDELHFLEEILHVTESGEASDIDVTAHAKNGTPVPLQLSLAPLQPNEDQFNGVMLVMIPRPLLASS